jgi:hypothetical protein
VETCSREVSGWATGVTLSTRRVGSMWGTGVEVQIFMLVFHTDLMVGISSFIYIISRLVPELVPD